MRSWAYFLSQKTFLSLMVDIFSLTENTEVTEVLSAQFRAHRTPPAYRDHRGLTPSPSPNGEGSSM